MRSRLVCPRFPWAAEAGAWTRLHACNGSEPFRWFSSTCNPPQRGLFTTPQQRTRGLTRYASRACEDPRLRSKPPACQAIPLSFNRVSRPALGSIAFPLRAALIMRLTFFRPTKLAPPILGKFARFQARLEESDSTLCLLACGRTTMHINTPNAGFCSAHESQSPAGCYTKAGVIRRFIPTPARATIAQTQRLAIW